MKSTIYTFKNKKKIYFTFPKYYLVENNKDVNRLIDKLLEVDAVFSPEKIDFPAVLKLKEGFSVTLEKASKQEIKKDLTKIKEAGVELSRFLKALS